MPAKPRNFFAKEKTHHGQPAEAEAETVRKPTNKSGNAGAGTGTREVDTKGREA